MKRRTLVALAIVLGCRDVLPPVVDDGAGAVRPELIASDPQSAPPNAALQNTMAGIGYVSLGEGMFPNATHAVVRVVRTDVSMMRPIEDGGLDPVAVDAMAGDAIEVSVMGDGAPVVLTTTAPSVRRPGVVRTIPPRGKKDVPLNFIITVVFSEPMAPSSVSGIRLLRDGVAVPGTVTLSDDGLRADLVPSQNLAANTEYTISVTTDVTDRSGQPLEQPVKSAFTTGVTIAAASITTEQAALVMDGAIDRIGFFYVRAIRDPAGNVTGAWTSWFDAPGWQMSGRVTCFRIIGRKAWIGGIIEKSNNPDFLGASAERVWIIEDNGPSQPGLSDRLSLVWHPMQVGLAHTDAFCEQTPLSSIQSGPVPLNNIISGNFTIRDGSAGAPPPPAARLSEIAYSAWPNGGIRVMSSAGTGGRKLTGDGDVAPVWSPDGKWIAFLRNSDGTTAPGIFVIRSDGTALRRLTNGVGEPAWSPDGKYIAHDADGVIRIIDVTTGAALPPIPYAGSHPAWSPDGKRIAVGNCGDVRPRVCVGPVDGSGYAPITPDTMSAWNPAWSPDGATIAFHTDKGIFLVAPDGSALRQLTYAGYNPAWSPDGRVIVYQELGINDTFGIKVINSDGSGMSNRASGLSPSWGPGAMPPMVQPELSIEVLSGDSQSDTAGARLSLAHAVRVRRADGSPAVGVRVDFVPNSPQDLRYDNTFTVTNAAGLADMPVTLGPVAGVASGRAMLVNGLGTSAGVLFKATVKAGNPIRLEPRRAPLDYSAVDSTEALDVAAVDRNGNQVPNVPVTWRLASGSASLTTLADTTREDALEHCCAIARTKVTFGPNEGVVEVEAQSPAVGDEGSTLFVANVVSNVVTISDRAVRDTISVAAGRTVAWFLIPRGDEDYYHDLRFDDDVSNVTRSNDENSWWTRTFTGPPRTVRYRCALHTAGFTGPESGVVIIR